MLKKVIDLIYPKRCPICGNIVPLGDALVHVECLKKLERVREPICKKCGKPIESPEQEYCMDCTKHQFSYTRGRSLWVYNHAIDASIFAYKYKGKREYWQFYSNAILTELTTFIKNTDPQVIIPVPLNKRKQIQRGYNQAEWIAKGISKKLEIPIDTHVLIRNRWTVPQKELSNKERIANLLQAFELEKNHQHYDRVLLIDDIYTTGSTIEACSKILKKDGVKEIYFITLCIGKGM